MLALEEACARILEAIRPLDRETIPLQAAAGRFISGTIHSPGDLPAFDNSAMDGYALCAGDLGSATADQPVQLKVAARIPAGRLFSRALVPGECARIFTGSPMPDGSDAVVMQEEVQTPDEDAARFFEAIRPGENVRRKGEDVVAGQELILPGTRVHAGTIALLAALGLEDVEVYRQPRVALLATGDELAEPGRDLEPGTIHESNRAALAALLQAAGAIPKSFPLVPDNLEQTCATLEQAFGGSDAVITTGGVSVGELDLVKAAFESLGGRTQFWKVAVKPGKPFAFGERDEKFLFGLPGNPVSAFVTFLLLVRPALLRWQGAANTGLISHPAFLAEVLQNRGDRRHFMRVHVDEAGRVRLAGQQASHALGSLARANGLVDVPPNSSLAEGALVQVLRWEV